MLLVAPRVDAHLSATRPLARTMSEASSVRQTRYPNESADYRSERDVLRNPIAKLREFARGRGWNDLRLFSSSENSFNRELGGETADGHQMPVMHGVAA